MVPRFTQVHTYCRSGTSHTRTLAQYPGLAKGHLCSRIAAPYLPKVTFCKVSSSDTVPSQSVMPARFVLLRQMQRIVAIVVGVAQILTLHHLLTSLGSPWISSWVTGHRRPSVLIALSTFFAAGPIEYSAMFWVSSSIAGACQAAGNIGHGKFYRALYVTVCAGGLFALLDNSPLSSQMATIGVGIFPGLPLAFFCSLELLCFTVCVTEIWVGLSATIWHGLPRFFRRSSTSKLSRLYILAEILCVFEMFRSPFWRSGRLLGIIATLDELRCVSTSALNLGSSETMELNRAVGIWALASLLEASILGVLSAAWATHFGAASISANSIGMLTALLAGFPALVTSCACTWGNQAAISALMSKAKSRRRRLRHRRLGRLALTDLEDLYMNAVGHFYKVEIMRNTKYSNTAQLDDFEYCLLKIRLQKAKSTVLSLNRADIQKNLLLPSEELASGSAQALSSDASRASPVIADTDQTSRSDRERVHEGSKVPQPRKDETETLDKDPRVTLRADSDAQQNGPKDILNGPVAIEGTGNSSNNQVATEETDALNKFTSHVAGSPNSLPGPAESASGYTQTESPAPEPKDTSQ